MKRNLPLCLFVAALTAPLSALAGSSSDAIQTPIYEVGVRASVDRWDGFKKKNVVAHGKVYVIAGAKQAPNGVQLVRPVDEAAMLNELRGVLAKQGFIEVSRENEQPDVVLTLLYGRGMLQNPYLEGGVRSEVSMFGVSTGGASNPESQPPSLTYVGAGAIAHELKRRDPGYMAKMEKANFEKLFVRVMAWQYPKPAKGKPKLLWKTTMIVDDPANRDLNVALKAMFAAGSNYFDKEILDPEKEVDMRIRDGRVEVGAAEVVQSTSKQ